MIKTFIIRLVKILAATLSASLTLVVAGAEILLFLPSDLYGIHFTRTRLLFCTPVFLVICGFSIAVIYAITYFFEERPFGFIDHFSYIPMHLHFGIMAVVLFALCLAPEMPPLPRIKESIPLTCLLTLSFPAIFYSGLWGIIITTDIFATKYKIW